jgi:hypothetical protein
MQNKYKVALFVAVVTPLFGSIINGMFSVYSDEFGKSEADVIERGSTSTGQVTISSSGNVTFNQIGSMNRHYENEHSEKKILVDSPITPNLGCEIVEDGWKYSGGCHDGVPDGIGKIWFENGEYHEGLFKNGFENGLGIRYFPDGDKVLGIWENGRYVKD